MVSPDEKELRKRLEVLDTAVGRNLEDLEKANQASEVVARRAQELGLVREALTRERTEIERERAHIVERLAGPR